MHVMASSALAFEDSPALCTGSVAQTHILRLYSLSDSTSVTSGSRSSGCGSALVEAISPEAAKPRTGRIGNARVGSERAGQHSMALEARQAAIDGTALAATLHEQVHPQAQYHHIRQERQQAMLTVHITREAVLLHLVAGAKLRGTAKVAKAR